MAISIRVTGLLFLTRYHAQAHTATYIKARARLLISTIRGRSLGPQGIRRQPRETSEQMLMHCHRKATVHIPPAASRIGKTHKAGKYLLQPLVLGYSHLVTTGTIIRTPIRQSLAAPISRCAEYPVAAWLDPAQQSSELLPDYPVLMDRGACSSASSESLWGRERNFICFPSVARISFMNFRLGFIHCS